MNNKEKICEWKEECKHAPHFPHWFCQILLTNIERPPCFKGNKLIPPPVKPHCRYCGHPSQFEECDFCMTKRTNAEAPCDAADRCMDNHKYCTQSMGMLDNGFPCFKPLGKPLACVAKQTCCISGTLCKPFAQGGFPCFRAVITASDIADNPDGQLKVMGWPV